MAILDIVFGAFLLVYLVRALRRPPDAKRRGDTIEKASKVASSPAVAILAAGATLANPGGFIPVALKQISQLNPSAGEYIVLWLGFALVALLPLLVALVSLLVARDWTLARLHAVRAGWNGTSGRWLR